MDPIQFRLRSFLAASIAVLLIGTGGFMFAEGLSFFDAFYFSIVTIATVGYGDFHPGTPFGKMLAITIIILGVGTFVGAVANASELMLNRREKEAARQKMHLLIGVFFSEIGNDLIKHIRFYDADLLQIREKLAIDQKWKSQDFKQLEIFLKTFQYRVDTAKIDLQGLSYLLRSKRSLMVSLLENPNLIEHESFTDLLRSVFHLTEELAQRQDVESLPQSDTAHLAGDIERVFRVIYPEWLSYMRFLSRHYPYLYSLAVRINPFDPEASPIVEEKK